MCPELDVLPAAQPIVSKHYRKTQWFGRLLFYISTPCLINIVKALKEYGECFKTARQTLQETSRELLSSYLLSVSVFSLSFYFTVFFLNFTAVAFLLRNKD